MLKSYSTLIFIIIYLNAQAVNKTNNMPCYRKDDRAMRHIYRLFHPVHAYVHYQSINQSINKTTYTKMTSGEQLK